MTSGEVLEAAGPEQIRAAFSTAVDTAGTHAGDLTGLAGVLYAAADRYEALQMSSSTLEHLREAASALAAAASTVGTGEQQLRDAAADFDARDGQVAAAVAEAGNLMDAAGYGESFTLAAPSGTLTFTDGSDSMTTSSTHVGTGAEPAEERDLRSERDRLARGFYLNGWDSYGRDRAWEWDAGRVDEQQRADAYEVADKILADRAAIADGPGADRMQVMRKHGVTACPDWCPQPDDEDQYEEHIGPGSSFTTANGDTVTVRPRVSWFSDVDPSVDIIANPGEGSDGVVLNAAELSRLQQISGDVFDDAQHHHVYAPAEQSKPAYPGAVFDAADAAWDVSDPAAAAEALDLTSRAGGYYFTEADDAADDETDGGPYLDWSCGNRQTQVRHLEAGDGVDATVLKLSGSELRELRDGIGRLIGAVNDGQGDPGVLRPGDEDEGAYIDWSSVEDGMRFVEFSDGDTAVVLDMPEHRLREWYERLALQVQLDEQDSQ
ncbi:hypothetical protein [Actinoplanes sp. G11-F43]|uniref:hypothetical protein n=1 Tax=Actinoplanes sp. G11-F43 TaxID=3424130 RepID=UPI003D33B732